MARTAVTATTAAPAKQRPAHSTPVVADIHLETTLGRLPSLAPVPAPEPVDAADPDQWSPCGHCHGLGALTRPDLVGLTQARIAELAGISESLVSRMMTENVEQLRQNPSLSTLRGLQRAFSEHVGAYVPLEIVAQIVEVEEG